jgi:hypothetical protein
VPIAGAVEHRVELRRRRPWLPQPSREPSRPSQPALRRQLQRLVLQRLRTPAKLGDGARTCQRSQVPVRPRGPPTELLHRREAAPGLSSAPDLLNQAWRPAAGPTFAAAFPIPAHQRLSTRRFVPPAVCPAGPTPAHTSRLRRRPLQRSLRSTAAAVPTIPAITNLCGPLLRPSKPARTPPDQPARLWGACPMGGPDHLPRSRDTARRSRVDSHGRAP